MSGKNTKNWAEISDDEEETIDENEKQEDSKQKPRSPGLRKESDSQYSNSHYNSYNGSKKRNTEMDREEIIEKLRKCKGKIKIILGNISYEADEHDIKDFYHGIKIASIQQVSKGTYSAEFHDIEEAIKLVNFKDTVLKKRVIKMKVERDRKNMDDYYDNYSGSGSHFSKKTSNFRPRHKKDYNRKEQYDEYEENDGGNVYYDNYYNKYAKQNDYEDYDDEDLNNYYDRKDQTNVVYVVKEERKPIGFVRREEKKNSDAKETDPNYQKPNPFGEAKPRDEKKFIHRNEEEYEDNLKHEDKYTSKSPEKLPKNTSYDERGSEKYYGEDKFKKTYTSNEKNDGSHKKNYPRNNNYEGNYYGKSNKRYKEEKYEYHKREDFKKEGDNPEAVKKKNQSKNQTFNRFDVLQN